MVVSTLASAAALVALEIAQIKNYQVPLVKHIKQRVCDVTKIALSSIPIISTFYKNYALIAGVLSEIQHHAICYVGVQGASKAYEKANDKIGEFFQSNQNLTFDPLGRFSQAQWNVHHPDFNKLSFGEVNRLLECVYEHTEDPALFQAQVAQILSKRLVSRCWNEMNEGFGIKIPILDAEGNRRMASYVLETKFDLWQNIPAFGFVDLEGKGAPLIIFRCTNPDTNFADSWPSLLANLHRKGPAWKIYEQSHQTVEKWLEKQTQGGEQKARIMGYSQGSALASYFLTYKSEWISQKEHEPSYLFDGPGISKEVYRDWKQLKEKPRVYQYFNRGDLVPKVGEGFVGKVFETSVPERLTPVEAHRALNLLSPRFKCVEVDLQKELKTSVRQAFSFVMRNASHFFYPVLRKLVVPKIQKVFYNVHFSS